MTSRRNFVFILPLIACSFLYFTLNGRKIDNLSPEPSRGNAFVVKECSNMDPIPRWRLSNGFAHNPKIKQRILIIGAGLTGLASAYRLYDLGIHKTQTQVVILEQGTRKFIKTRLVKDTTISSPGSKFHPFVKNLCHLSQASPFNCMQGILKSLPHGWFHFKSKVESVDLGQKIISVKMLNYPQIIYNLTYDLLLNTISLDNFVLLTQTKSLDIKRYLAYEEINYLRILLSGKREDLKCLKLLDTVHHQEWEISLLSQSHDNGIKGKIHEQYAKEDHISSILQTLTTNGIIDNTSMVDSVTQTNKWRPRISPDVTAGLTDFHEILESHSVYSRGFLGGWNPHGIYWDRAFMMGVEVTDWFISQIPEETFFQGYGSKSRSLTAEAKFQEDKEFAYEVVVAHYNEKWTEVESLCHSQDNCHCYHKGLPQAPNFELFKQFEYLPNVGREVHTYLHHIVHNYHHLANITLFRQARMLDHKNRCYEDFKSYWPQAKSYGFSSKFLRNKGDWGKLALIPRLRRLVNLGFIPQWNFTMAEFWDRYILAPRPEAYKQTLMGCHAVSRKVIKSRPLEYYKTLIKLVDWHQHPVEVY